MKRLILLLIPIMALMVGCSSANKQERELRKIVDARRDSMAAVAAMESLKAMDFAVAADRISLKHGGSYSVNSTINFIAVKGDRGVVQIASPVANPGPNGIGGVTLEGAVRNAKLSFDKKGNATLMYSVSGSGLTADITVRLPKGQVMATANVDAAYWSAGMMIYGKLSPYSQGRVVKGTSF